MSTIQYAQQAVDVSIKGVETYQMQWEDTVWAIFSTVLEFPVRSSA